MSATAREAYTWNVWPEDGFPLHIGREQKRLITKAGHYIKWPTEMEASVEFSTPITAQVTSVTDVTRALTAVLSPERLGDQYVVTVVKVSDIEAGMRWCGDNVQNVFEAPEIEYVKQEGVMYRLKHVGGVERAVGRANDRVIVGVKIR